VGVVPWGFTNPPPVPAVVEAPGRFHPVHRGRRILSLAGRASPRRYAIGLLLGLPAGLLFLAYEIAGRGGFKLGETPVPPWVVLELVTATAALGLIAGAAAQGSQRRADGWRDFAGPSPFLLAAAQQATVFALILPVAAILTRLSVDPESAVGLALLVPAYLASYFGLVHLLGVRTGALTWRDILHPKRLAPDIEDWTDDRLAFERGTRRPSTRLRGWLRGPLGDVLVALTLLLPIMIATGLTNSALVAVLQLGPTDLGSDIPLDRTAFDQVLLFASVAVVLPIGEEVFFRGYCTNAWGRSLTPTSALLRAALFFAFVHVANTSNTDIAISLRAAAFNFGARVPVALALCWIYMRRRSLVASSALHVAYNGLIVLISFAPLP
jgi:membrane protease YdiL (CAAX protease family)